MPNGEIQPEFVDRLHWMGNWLKTYGESVYNNKGGYLRPQKWGCLTQAKGKLYVHVLQQNSGVIRLEKFPYAKIGKAYLLKTGAPVAVSLKDGVAELSVASPTAEEPDQVVVVEIAKK